jgi:hypothetical protein
MADNISPYLQNSSNTIILLKLRIEEVNSRITYLYDHYIPDTSLGPEFYWDASNYLRVTGDGAGGGSGVSKAYVDGSLYTLKEYTDKKWRNIQRHGFVDNSETILSYDPDARELSLAPVDSSWNFMQDGSLYNVFGSKTIPIPNETSDGGNYHVYIDASDGTLLTTFDSLNLTDSKVHVATVVWNADLTPSYQLVDERHTVLIDKRVHYHLHNTVGAHYIAGGDVSGFLIGSSTNMMDETLTPYIFDSSSSFNRFGISPTTIIDEDLIFNLAGMDKPDGISPAYSTFYRNDISSWVWGNSEYPYVYDASGIKWDASGVLIDPSANYFVNSYLLYTTIDGSSRYVIIPGQGQYESLKDAVTETPVRFDWGGFPIEEYVIGWQFTWETSANFVTMPGSCALANDPKEINLNPRTALFDSYKIYHNATGGLQGGNGTDEYWHVTKAEKKAIAILAPDVSKLQDVISDVRWLPTDASHCEVVGGYNTGMKIITYKEQKKLDPAEWKDTGRTEDRSETNTTSCPVVPYRAAMYVGLSWNQSAATNIPFSFGSQVSLMTPTASSYNFLFLSIPAGRSFTVADGAGFDITGNFIDMGEDDIMSGYRPNRVFRKNPKYASSKSLNFKLTIN